MPAAMIDPVRPTVHRRISGSMAKARATAARFHAAELRGHVIPNPSRPTCSSLRRSMISIVESSSLVCSRSAKPRSRRRSSSQTTLRPKRHAIFFAIRHSESAIEAIFLPLIQILRAQRFSEASTSVQRALFPEPNLPNYQVSPRLTSRLCRGEPLTRHNSRAISRSGDHGLRTERV